MAELEYDGPIKIGGLAPLSALGAPAQRRGKETAVFMAKSHPQMNAAIGQFK